METKKKPSKKPAKKAAAPSWPKKTEARELRCTLTKDEIQAFGHEQAEAVQAISGLEDAKKASAARYKSEIEEKQARCNRLANYITSGWIEREVSCFWMYEFSGRDKDTKKYIPDPSKKILIRSDTGDVVTCQPITDAERQLVLPLDGSKAEEPKAKDAPKKKANPPD